MAVSTGRAFSSEVDIDLPAFKTYLFEENDMAPLPTKATTSSDELMKFYLDMQTIRRMEVVLDTEYKSKMIRGFCHLCDGQEAVYVGVEAGATRAADWIASYRCHGIAYCRGDTPEMIIAELMGKETGSSKGIGGSMHFYNKDSKFWGGAGIVGAQVPVGVGNAFANMYMHRNGDSEDLNMSMSFYGDGAANQGQIWEATNMAKLWNLPAVFVVENNLYGMGTSVARHSSVQPYYEMGKCVPGLWVDGMDVLAVREAFAYARQHCASGKGPLYIEIETYRYHGHSMSDPGLTYRDREEVQNVRKTSDCIALVKKRILDNEFATEKELKAIDKEVRADIAAANDRAKAASFPAEEELYTEIYWNETPPFIRGVELQDSRTV